MAVVIAALQLVIAFPQLKIAYNSFLKDETGNLKDAFSDFVHHTDELAIIQIPDSLMSPEIVSIRQKQNELFFYLKLLSHTDFSFEINSDNPRYIEASITSTILRMQQIGNCCSRINEIELDLYENYFPIDRKVNYMNYADSQLNDLQRILLLYLPTQQFANIFQIQTQINQSLNKYLTEMGNKRYNNVKEIKNIFIKNMPLKQYSEYL